MLCSIVYATMLILSHIIDSTSAEFLAEVCLLLEKQAVLEVHSSFSTLRLVCSASNLSSEPVGLAQISPKLTSLFHLFCTEAIALSLFEDNRRVFLDFGLFCDDSGAAFRHW